MPVSQKPRKARAARKEAGKPVTVQPAPEAPQSVTVPAEVFQQILNVLSEIPFKNVSGLMNLIQQTAQQGVLEEIVDPASGAAEAK